ncbi:hypothetical protein ASD04_08890 [Devosia sp. Root436]|uniref:hypothetical protein n=1 Tax=Devosia sp. Root436 TaxID=1736537 RepID=UPI000701D3CE|nr:hypothetical protein [Devosia sp. Root436]KQX38759.1 hypothetical protein ASD04_08890 [Devosia sp. Root436]
MNTIIKGGAAALVLLGSALPVAAEDVYFTLYNESNRSLHYFYASPSNSTSWGPDLLRGGYTLRAGYNGTVTIADDSTECYYDFKFIMGDRSETVVNEINICDLGSYTIYD